jgi:predicted SAM-dependent methyltransferase
MQNIQELNIYPNFSLVEKRLGRKAKLLYTAFPVIPRNAFIPFSFEIYLAWIRIRTRGTERKYKDTQDLLVNLGCGTTGKQGWVNVDAFNVNGVNCLYDCRKKLPFPDASVKGIFTEHFFEHLDYVEEVPYFLSECHRVLQDGGVLRIIIPSAVKYLQAYFKESWSDLSDIRPLSPEREDLQLGGRYHTKMEVINVAFRNGFQHKFAYDFETLVFLLDRYGFPKILEQEFGKSLMPELCIDQPHRMSESLYVEAVK